jgi:hypothetical protein
VSNTFASALWALDTLFTMRSDGVDGVNLHTFPSAASSLFDFGHIGSKWAAVVHPEYYGLLMFERASPAGSRLLKLSSTSIGSLRIWATISRPRGVHVLLVNDSLSRPETVRVIVPLVHAARPTVTALTAPSAFSTIKVTLGGLSFGPATTTGTLGHVAPGAWSQPTGLPYAILPPAHHAASDELARTNGGPARAAAASGMRIAGDTYTITVPPASAELLDWPGSLPGLH